MAWFLNRYECYQCARLWTDRWSCNCDDDCPHCGARHTSPFDSDDLTFVIVEDSGSFVVMRSPDNAEHRPDYEEIGRFQTEALAAEFMELAIGVDA